MAIERIIGVDFGTSTSVIRVKRYENGKPVGSGARLDTQKVFDLVPTVIQEMNGHRYYGEEALTPKSRNAIIYRGFKVDLESTDEEKREQARKLTKEFMAYLAAAYKTDSEGGHLGDSTDKERTIISYPVKWSVTTKAFMLEAARKAGFPNVEGMDEAQAAINAVVVQNQEMLLSKKYLQEDLPATILLIDMGAGTTDLVLCRYTPGKQPKNEILATWPKDGNILFGGQEVDEFLRNWATQLFEDKTQAEFVLKRIPLEQFKAWKETEVAKLLENNETVEQFYTLDDLADMAGVALKPYNLDRVAFESWAESYLKQFPELVKGCLQSAGIAGEQVDLVVLTGGHSQWYFAKDILAGKMLHIAPSMLNKVMPDSSRIISITRPQETVALGLVYSGFHVKAGNVSPDHAFELMEIAYREKTPDKVEEYLLPFTQERNPVAQWLMGEWHLDYTGDMNAAYNWFCSAAEQGHMPSISRLGEVWYADDSMNTYNPQKAEQYLLAAAESGDNYASVALLAMYVSSLNDRDKAIDFAKKSAEEGNAGAQYILGTYFFDGVFGEGMFETAMKWFDRALKCDKLSIAYKVDIWRKLAQAYEKGLGVDIDRKRAAEYGQMAEEYAKIYELE